MYEAKNLYPQMGLYTTFEETLPDPSERKSVEPEDKTAPEATANAGRVWFGVILLLALILLLNLV